MGRIGDPGFRLPTVGIWLGLLLAASPDRVVGQGDDYDYDNDDGAMGGPDVPPQPNVIGCDQTLASVVAAGAIVDWTFTSPGGQVRISTCDTGTDTLLTIAGTR